MGRAVHQYSQEGAFGSEPENRPMDTHRGPEDDTTDLPEPEGESRREDAVYTSGSASCISVQIKTVSRGPRPAHEQTLTLADLVSDREETEGDSSHQTSVEVPDPDPAPAQEPNIQAGPVPGLHPGPQVPSFPSSSTSQLGRGPEALPPPAAADPFRQLVQDQMFRLVQFQQMSFISLLQTVAASFPNPSQLNQNPIPTDHLSQLNQSHYPIPTANLPPLDHTQYPIPTENLPQLNQSQYPISPANLPPLNHPQYPIPPANLPPLNHPQYPIPPANLPPLNHPQYPIPPANLPPLNHPQYPIPTANPPRLIQTHQPGAPFFPPRPDPHQFGPQNQGPVPTPQPHALERLHTEQNLGPDPETQPWAGQADELELLHSVSPSSESPSLGNMESLSEELPVRLEELRGTQTERGSACVTPVRHQGLALLCAAGSSATPPPAPTGLKLLQLPPRSSLPPPAVPTGLLYSSAVPPLPREAFVHPRADPPVLPREGGRGWRKPAQRAFEVPPDQSVRQVAQPKLLDGPGQGSGQGGPLQLILAPPSHRQPLPRGLPLLRFHPEPRLPAPPAPFTTPATPLISVPSPPGFPEVPGHPAFPAFSSGIQLLQRAPDQPSKVLLGRVAWAPECGERAGPRLLTMASQAHPAQDTLASSKRQKRREEREQEGQSRSLGRPEDSSISPTEADKAEPSGSALEEDMVDESGSSVLAGPDLISRALSTAAELHAFASTQKRPPQLHDASTNTDSAGAVQVETAAAACPGVLLNLQFPREAETAVQQGPDTVSAGRHFINVINLEDEDLLEHLPSRQASASPTGPTSTPVSPHTHRPGAPVPNHTSTEQMTVETVLDTQLEPSERPSPPVIPGLWGISEPGQDKEPLGLLVEIEPLSLPNSSRLGLGLRDSLGLSVSFRDVEEQSTSSRGGVGRSADAFDSMMERSGKFSDGPLDLSDTGDTLTELGGLRGASTYSLGPSDSLRDRFLRWGEQNNVGVEEEEQREELRAWMKKKQKERIAEYRRQREEKREQEHRPFTPSSTQNLTSRDLSTNKKMKEKKEKTLLLEHHTLRAREACSLITELLKPSPALPTLTKAQPSQSTNQSSRRPKAQPSQSTNQSSRRPKAHPSQSTNQSSRRTAGVRSISAQRGEHQPTTRRLHRPGALPDARLTRWGVQDTRGRRPGKGWMKGIRPPLKEDRMRREREVREEVEEESDDEQLLSPWNPPLEIRRLLGLDKQGSVEERSGAPGSGAGVWLKGLDRDSPSESTGSILSKLDWTAIEKMVAEEDQV
ncbi:nascent polypeptide-associated complex subunit alpha, muscle-specific form-like [Conger conger]|uniref:nascent polypeptide-associated complex subunit alpha, muscle-specific form-like n=1 Tax=Conger conger TaxID=82655 RepID=UPI002A5A18C3|nr:nascent polypeptide-associated complex subunit alpha, muscle-specific form-like [Conger conger]